MGSEAKRQTHTSAVLTAAECRRKARECAELARRARDDPSRRLYEQLVLHWLEMAVAVERKRSG